MSSFTLACCFSPLQALMVREFVHSRQLDPSSVRVVSLTSTDSLIQGQMERSLDFCGFVDHEFIAPNAAAKLAWLRRNKALVASAETVVLGGYHLDFMRAVGAAANSRSEIVAVDDGTMTLPTWRMRRFGESAAKSQYLAGTRREARWRAFTKARIGLGGRELERITFYSLFEIPPGPTDRLERNDLGWLRSLREASAAERRDETGGLPVVVGHVMDAAGVVSRPYGAALRRAMVAAVGGGEFLYVPHRREGLDLTRVVHRTPGFQLWEPGLPLEAALVDTPTPSRIVTTVSTTVDTLPCLYDGSMRIELVVPTLENVSSPARSNIAEVIWRARRTRPGVEVSWLDETATERAA